MTQPADGRTCPRCGSTACRHHHTATTAGLLTGAITSVCLLLLGASYLVASVVAIAATVLVRLAIDLVAYWSRP